MSYAYTEIRPTHFTAAGGTWTACGLPGAQHRPIRLTNDPMRVSCKRCRKWIAKQAATPQPKNVTPKEPPID